VVNANWYQDISGASSGQTAQLQFIRPLTRLQGDGALRLNGVAGAAGKWRGDGAPQGAAKGGREDGALAG
jgi:hypothetical protein